MTEGALPIGSKIGILGGGQLGRMLCVKAIEMGYQVHIYSQTPNPPAGAFAHKVTIGDYDDEDALTKFSKTVDMATVELEHIPAKRLSGLQDHIPLYPHADVLETTQNRILEKSFLERCDVPTARWWQVRNHEDLAIVRRIHPVTVLKLAHGGYDGKGQWMVTQTSTLPTFHDYAILEEKVSFEKEISVIVARGRDGSMVNYPPVHNVHKSHMLHETFAPADIKPALAEQAVAIACKLAEELGVVGLLAVEMFVTLDNQILVNELAPRPHNSGHWSMDGADISQFELCLRAVCGLPLFPPKIIRATHMVNIVGEDVHQAQHYLTMPDTKLYLYGKEEVREGRKMGHVNILK